MDRLPRTLTRDEPIGWVQISIANARPTPRSHDHRRPIPGGTYSGSSCRARRSPHLARGRVRARAPRSESRRVRRFTLDARTSASTLTPERRLTEHEARPQRRRRPPEIAVGGASDRRYVVETRPRTRASPSTGARRTRISSTTPRAYGTVRDVEWEQLSAERARVTIDLPPRAYGYLVLWERSCARLELCARVYAHQIRGHPAAAGLTIAVDRAIRRSARDGADGVVGTDASRGMRLKALLEERGDASS